MCRRCRNGYTVISTGSPCIGQRGLPLESILIDKIIQNILIFNFIIDLGRSTCAPGHDAGLSPFNTGSSRTVDLVDTDRSPYCRPCGSNGSNARIVGDQFVAGSSNNYVICGRDPGAVPDLSSYIIIDHINSDRTGNRRTDTTGYTTADTDIFDHRP